jgi:hypothetical protein
MHVVSAKNQVTLNLAKPLIDDPVKFKEKIDFE